MILRRIAFLVALVSAFVATQVPAFILQYRQALGGAVGELSAIVSRFDSDCAQAGLSESGGIARLKSNADPLARERGFAIEETVERLLSLREAQDQFRTGGPVTRLATFVTHYDSRVGRGAFSEFQPAVPTTAEGFVAGLIGFLFGGGVVHMAGRPISRRFRQERTA